MRKPNILYIFGGEKSSGAEFVIETLIRNNDAVNSTLLMAPGTFFFKLEKENLPYRLQSTKYLRKLNTENKSIVHTLFHFVKNIYKINREVAKMVRKQNFDVVHTNTIVPTFYLLPLFILFRLTKRKIKLVWSDHDIIYRHKIFIKTLPLIYRIYDKTLVVSNAVAAKYDKREKVAILHNGLNPTKINISSALRTAFRSHYNIDENVLVFGIIGQIVPRKGINELVKAFNEFIKICKDCDGKAVLIVGGLPSFEKDPYYEEFCALIKNNKQILYIGYCDSVNELYNGIDVLINNSIKEDGEPLGTTIIEGLAYGKIVLATDSGGTKEIIESGVSGILCKDSIDRSSLADIFDARNKNIEMRENARIKFEKDFLLEHMICNYNKYIKEIL